MTEYQKKTIREMRFRGYGYKLIAKELRLKRDTVRDYCRGHELTGRLEDFFPEIQAQMDEGLLCRNCGFPIEQPARGKRVFCSPRCMNRYNKHKDENAV